jgi:hypothetical protein
MDWSFEKVSWSAIFKVALLVSAAVGIGVTSAANIRTPDVSHADIVAKLDEMKALEVQKTKLTERLLSVQRQVCRHTARNQAEAILCDRE